MYKEFSLGEGFQEIDLILVGSGIHPSIETNWVLEPESIVVSARVTSSEKLLHDGRVLFLQAYDARLSFLQAYQNLDSNAACTQHTSKVS